MFTYRKRFTFLNCPSVQDCRTSMGARTMSLLFTQQHTVQNDQVVAE